MSEAKVLIIGGLVTLFIFIGGVFFMTRSQNQSVPKDQIVSSNGIHWHPKVFVYIKGEKQSFPNGIGLNGPVHNPIHTHEDADQGIIHMEFSGIVKKEDTTLAKFFEIWGKTFNSTQIFDKKNGPEGTVKMFVNGKENKDFENYLMRDRDIIEIRYE